MTMISDSNLGLIMRLSIGGFVLIVGATIAGFFLYRKRTILTQYILHVKYFLNDVPWTFYRTQIKTQRAIHVLHLHYV